jgi:small conductance mechanosensitive channel
MTENISQVMPLLLNALLIGIAGFLGAFLLAWVLGKLLARPLGKVWGRFVANLVGLAAAIGVMKIILDTTGAAGLLVVLASAVTGAFAIGSERIAADIVSGVSLLFAKPYEAGDYVMVAGQEGQVLDVTLFLTTLVNVGGDQIFIRNSDITGNTIINYSSQPGRLTSVKLRLPFVQNLPAMLAALEKGLLEYETDLDNQVYRPSLVVEDMGNNYVDLSVRVYLTNRRDYGVEKTRLFLEALNILKSAGFPLN